jgi:hypothetical protein
MRRVPNDESASAAPRLEAQRLRDDKMSVEAVRELPAPNREKHCVSS